MATTEQREARTPQCRKCYKMLPANFIGFKLCPMCMHKQSQRRSLYQSREPSYANPTTALTGEPNARGF